MTDKPTITQADHDAFESAAIPLLVAMRNNNSNISEIIIEAFAKHRESSVAELKAENERLRKALEYYAENGHYDHGDAPCHIYVIDDHGRTARAALSQKEPVE